MAQKQKRSQASDINASTVNLLRKYKANTLDSWNKWEVSAQVQDMRQKWEGERNTINCKS